MADDHHSADGKRSMLLVGMSILSQHKVHELVSVFLIGPRFLRYLGGGPAGREGNIKYMAESEESC